MNPLMLQGLLPDGVQSSREAAWRHTILTTLKEREHPPLPLDHEGGSRWFSSSHSPSSVSSA